MVALLMKLGACYQTLSVKSVSQRQSTKHNPSSVYEDAHREIELELDLSGSIDDRIILEEAEEDFRVEDLACT